MKKFVWGLVTFVLLLGSGFASVSADVLGPSPYLRFADSPFNGLVFSYFHLENFEDGVFNPPGVTVNGGVVLSPNSLTDSVDADDGTVDGSGTGGRSVHSNGQISTFTFTFNAGTLGALPTHVGIVWTDVGSSQLQTGFDDVTFEAFDAANVSIGNLSNVRLGDGRFDGTTAEDRFFGATHVGGIARITIASQFSRDWEVDHLQYGRAVAPTVVPEPATLTLLCLSVPLLIGLAWRRNSARKPSA